MREAGVQELLVVSQDTSAYGIDLKGDADLMMGTALRPNIVQLSEALAELELWVRLHYVYPYRSVDRLVELMADGLILPYLDVPFQHSSPKVLRQMKRPASGEDNLERVESWRALAGAGDVAALAGELIRHHYDPRYARQRGRDGAGTLAGLRAERLEPDDLHRLADRIVASL